ncbi:ATP-binding protein [Aromatoleum diolicum]|uniref:ATP-binding protein n=1 Tax=Aromatoleum diolicum TaxID=75796 RepID=A0ABX1QH66_9RHOO|nr:ATP-binding protein [Aromatoleum diolicum]NMG77658.1 ATP-binding protein [Aromatoleum diolicum]
MLTMLEKIEAILEQKPGQKAKEIATQLRKDKTEINRLLYANKDFFVQDLAEYTWALVELRIELGSTCWLTADLFEKALLAVESPLDSATRRVKFVVGEDCKILLEALALLLAICNQLVDSGKLVSVDFTASKSTLTYLNRMGFIDLLRSQVKVLPNRPRVSAAQAYEGNNDAVVELREIDHLQPDDSIPDLLGKSFVACAGDQYDVAVHTVISELFGNVQEHSGATSAGFAGLQYYPRGRRRHIQTVISDGGHGIVGTLMPILETKYPKLAKNIAKSKLDYRVALLQEIFSKGGISQVNDSGRGLGLKGSGSYAQKYNALISVRQENFVLKITHFGELIQFSHCLNLARIAGTHICFDFLLD